MKNTSCKYRLILAFAAAFLLFGMFYDAPAGAKESDPAIEKISSTFDSMIQTMIESSPKKDIIVAIPFTDQKESDRRQVNAATACHELLAERIALHKNISVVDQDTVNEILERLQLFPSGIYSSQKLSALGRLLDADFIIVTASDIDSSQNDIKIKCVDVAGDRIISQSILSVPGRVLEKSAQDYLIDRHSSAYKPYPVRLLLFIPWIQHIKTDMRPFEAGISAGASYDLSMRHSFIVNVNYFTDQDHWYVYQDTIVQDKNDTDYRVYSAINLNSSFESTIGYGYIFKTLPIMYIRPRINLGILYKEYDYEHSYQSRPEGIPPAYAYLDRDTETFTSYVVQPLIDFLFYYNSRVSYSFSVGYDYVFSPFNDSWAYTLEGSGSMDADFSGILLSGGIAVYF